MTRLLVAILIGAATFVALNAHVRAETPEVLPRPDFHFKGKVGKTYKDSDPPEFPQPVQAPKGAPNVVLIMLDDTGFGQYSTFGGGIPSPTLDKLASEGLKYNRFHTTALCSPTRAALITGRNHHSAATGVITEAATGYDGYTSIIPRSAGSIAEVLRQNGYMTAWIGKNHNTPAWETSLVGPFDRWANGLGFDYFYGFNAGDMNHWDPFLYENRNLVPRSKDPDYHLTEDIADRAIDWVRRSTSIAPDKPFFLYVAPGANHSPHHAPKAWIDKFKGQFDQGWDAYREATLARQLKAGVVPKGTKLTARSEGLPAWDSLNADQKRLYARMMEVFAGYAAHVDHHMGRVIDAVKKTPNADNTIFIYIVGDNGASAEGGLDGSLNENLFFNGFPEKWQENIKHIDELGGPKWFNHFPSAWAHAMSTPFQWTKQVASHFGGTRNPMIISWPEQIKDQGGLRSQFLHVIDIVPTLYEAIGVTPPKILNGIEQKPLEGFSFLQTFKNKNAPETHKTQYFELLVNRGMYHDGWMASSRSFVPWEPTRGDFDPFAAKWELYNINEDFSQAVDLAEKHPDKVKELEAIFWKEAEKYSVLPLDWRATVRLNAELQGRPSLAGKRSQYVYYPGQVALPDGASPPVLNKSFSVTMDLDIPENGAEGMIFTHGGLTGGYGIYLRDGKAHFVYNMLAVERYTVSSDVLPKGRVKLVADVAYQGGKDERGKPAKVTLSVDGKKVGEGNLPKTIPLQFSLGEGVDVGTDTGSAIDFTYNLPFDFTGKIEKVTVDLKK
ncbi:arylsulfatase [Microbulbifer sp. CAU 1566]|uniref:arylsulfatase n=1 Tax=Microbulbifer sp. CAU 1566 TaxID=2933269 RepID=UPI002003C4C5|nr:arylsulfatase [Microbulbifer sp. CAU 1566]MCK7599008.1 arylsulfatase [Microbulbifer sp. CAU 1566]